MVDTELMQHLCTSVEGLIIGRRLNESISLSKANHNFGKIGAKELVKVCPCCDAIALGADTAEPAPFLCQDGVFRTAQDFLPDAEKASPHVMAFSIIRFTHSAFASTVKSAMKDPKLADTEKSGRELVLDDRESVLGFSENVIDWGRGGRVQGKLWKLNPGDTLYSQLNAWFKTTREAQNPQEAISPGIKIRGLGVSFASKHLRMLNPKEYPVLDEIIAVGLGFAPNPAGYTFFIQCIKEFRTLYQLDLTVAEIEMGLFGLMRQVVRSEEAGEVDTVVKQNYCEVSSGKL